VLLDIRQGTSHVVIGVPMIETQPIRKTVPGIEGGMLNRCFQTEALEVWSIRRSFDICDLDIGC
jgi:hypothetical protein